jgi:hypothetical protein
MDDLIDKEQQVSDTMAGTAGVFAVAGAGIYNIVLGLANGVIEIGVGVWNLIARFAHDFGTIFDDPVGSVIRLIGDMADVVYDILGGLATALDWIFGSNLASGVQSWQDDMDKWLDDTFGARSTEVKGIIDAEDWKLKFERIDYLDAADAGVEWGRKFAESFKIEDPTSEEELQWLNATANYTGETAKNTSSLNGVTDEIIKYMRDIAERDMINRFTTAEVKVEMGGVTNNLNSDVDIDGFVDGLAHTLEEQLSRTAESANFG